MNNPESDLTIYRKLQEHLNNLPVGFPATESGVEIRILEHLFAPEEARIAIHLSYLPEPIDKIYRKVKRENLTKEQLRELLNKMIQKGSINYGELKGEKVYGNSFLAIGMYEYQLDRLTPDFVKDFHQYVDEAYLEEFHRKTSQIRVIPVEKSLSPDLGVATYENARKIIENSGGPIAVAECICKKGQDLIGEPCKRTTLREICFSFRGAASFYIDKGFAREIDKEEALTILTKAEQDGLILQTGNSQKPSFLCCCCTCCCGLLRSEKKLDNPSDYVLNNYRAQIDTDLCNGCNACLDTCQMEAIKTENDFVTINKALCIGCGNCIITCPQSAISLIKKEIIHVPPKNTYELYLNLMKNN